MPFWRIPCHSNAHTLPAGKHNVTWDATDNAGRSVASGVGFYQLETSNYSSTKKMVLLK